MSVKTTVQAWPENFDVLLPRLHCDTAEAYHLSGCAHTKGPATPVVPSSFELDTAVLCHHCGADRAAASMKRTIGHVGRLRRLQMILESDSDELGWLKVAGMQAGARSLLPLDKDGNVELSAAAAHLAESLTAAAADYRDHTEIDLTAWRQAALLSADPRWTVTGVTAGHLAEIRSGSRGNRPAGRFDEQQQDQQLQRRMREYVVNDLLSGSTWEQATAAARRLELRRAEILKSGPADTIGAALDGTLTLWSTRITEWAAELSGTPDLLVLAKGADELSRSYLTGYSQLLAPARHTVESSDGAVVLAVVPAFVWSAMCNTEINSRDAEHACLGEAEPEDAAHLALMLRLHTECPALTLADLRIASRGVAAAAA